MVYAGLIYGHGVRNAWPPGIRIAFAASFRGDLTSGLEGPTNIVTIITIMKMTDTIEIISTMSIVNNTILLY